MPIKPLSFKGDKKSKKRKHPSTTTTFDDSATIVPSHPSDPTAEGEEDETWASPNVPSDLTGPTLLVLPTTPPCCLASDANGAIFASPLENIIEANPETAEPHDVRQVWVATRTAGMAEGNVSFKGAHGGYLSCDSYGVMGAVREARGTEEGFVVESAATALGGAEDSEGDLHFGKFLLRTAASTPAQKDKNDKETSPQTKFLCAVSTASEDKKKLSISIRGDGEAGDLGILITIRMQARFKPQVQAAKTLKASAKVSRKELEVAVGRRLEDDEVKRLKRARKNGTYHEEILDVRVKGKHDKFAS